MIKEALLKTKPLTSNSMEHECLRFPSLLERFVAQHVQHFNSCHPEILADLKNKVGAAQRWWPAQKLMGPSKVPLDDWVLRNKTAFLVCADAIVSELRKQHVAKIRSEIIASLNYTEMNYRYNAVTRAQARTFDWVFQPYASQDGSNVSFSRWLAEEDPGLDRVYWIRGKPGSGKSTLMRHLCDHHMTRAIANLWSASKTLLVVKCFFWSSGSPMQRSQQGLLRTLLYQMLTACPDFSASICTTQWNLIKHRLIASYASGYLGPIPSMSPMEIQNAIANFALQYKDSIKMLLLIDGLDEFEGEDEDRRDVCVMLTSLTQAVNVKICTASRPWNVYTDFFEDFPKLRLELLTQNDINAFVTHALHANARFSRWQKVQPDVTQQIIEDVVGKAEGVFLWVVLVVHSLLKGVHNGDDIRELKHRLEVVPSDLSDLFEQMLSKLDPSYLESASQIFDIALQGNHLLMLYFFMHVDDQSIDIVKTIREHGMERVIQLQELEERRINARCMGLLEFNLSSEGIDHGQSGLRMVSFLHRTARDYMESQQERLMSWRKSHWDSQAATYRSTLLLTLSCSPTRPWLTPTALANYYQDVFSKLDHTSAATECLEIVMSNERHFEETVTALAAKDCFIAYSLSPADRPNLLTFAIVQGADAYALQKIKPLQTLDEAGRRPLLHYTVNPEYRKYRPPSIELSRALLERGASPNAVWHGQTVWSETIQCIPVVMRKQERNLGLITPFGEVLKLLMSAGASDFQSTTYGTRGRIVDSGNMILWHFPENTAKDIIGVGKYFRVYEDPHSFRVRLKARFRRWKLAGNS